MSKSNDGGPAFPHLGLYAGADGNLHPRATQFGGMSLRDWFAGQALAGIGTWWPIGTQHGGTVEGLGLSHSAVLTNRAEWAYRQADAMLSAREASESEQ